MHNGIEFFTATCLNWQPLLKADERKDILMNSLRFMVEEKRIWLYAFVIMPNHIHLLWSKQEAWKDKNTSHMFLKFTAQQIKFNLIDNGQNEELQNYKSTQQDRAYHFWERRPFVATMFNKKVAEQKMNRKSSRGHGLITINIIPSGNERPGKICFIDLAGC